MPSDTPTPQPLSAEEEHAGREEVAHVLRHPEEYVDGIYPTVLGVARLFATLDASRARVRELEADRAIQAGDYCLLHSLAAEMAEALAKFAADADAWDHTVPDDHRSLCTEPGSDTAHPGSETLYTVGDLRRARTTLARYRAQAEGDGGWLPIESAPKDGTAILAGRGGENPWGIPYILAWLDGPKVQAGPGWYRTEGRDWSTRALRPTHWRPLPPPPASEQEGR